MLEQVLKRNAELIEKNNELLERLIELQGNFGGCQCGPDVAEIAEAVEQTEEKIEEVEDTVEETFVNEEPDVTEEPAEEDSTEEKPSYTLADVRAALVAYTDGKGKAATLRLLGRFHASKLSEVGEDNYADIIAEVQDAIRKEVA